VEDEEVDEREQRGADDERRHGRRQPAAAALARRRRRRGRLVLVPLHTALVVVGTGQWHLLCSAPVLLNGALPPAGAGRSVVGLAGGEDVR
jgi:hypothetical protein